MSISEKLTKLNTDISNAYNSIETKGGTVPVNKNTENLASAIESIEGVAIYTVTFDSDGGTEVSSQVVISGNVAVEPISPEKDEYMFKYWTLNGEVYDFSTPVTSDITLVAMWETTKEYIELEYIECSGTQYIDTGVILNANIKIEDWITGNIDNVSLNGSDGPDSSTSKFRFKYGFNLGNWAIGYADKWLSIYKTSKPIDTNTFYKFTIGKGIQKIEPDIFSYEYNYELGAYPTRTMLLFALRENTNKIMYATNLKRKECKIYNGDTLIRDFIPVIRKSDNVAMMYDLVNSEFYPNVGTGSFTAGAIKQ